MLRKLVVAVRKRQYTSSSMVEDSTQGAILFRPFPLFSRRTIMPFRIRPAFIVLIALLPGIAAADDSKAIVQRGKRATALVVLPAGQGFGSSFCIDAAGFFVTNEHVVHSLPKEAKVSLVLQPGEAGERVVQAVVVRADARSDLALLKAEGAKELEALELGGVDDLVETAPVTAFGYPFGDRLAVREKQYPNVSVNVGRVTSLRRAHKELEAIQIDAVLNPGNSGGPVLDANGLVVGIVRAGIVGSGVNFAIGSIPEKGPSEHPWIE
jgi:S1-C subfamily serine protease